MTGEAARAPWVEKERIEMLIEIGKGTEFVSRLIGNFGEAGTRLVEGLRESLRAGDFDRTRDAAHALKGSASELGGTSLSELCLGIERMQDEELVRRDTTRLVREVSDALEHTRTAMLDYLKDRKPD